MRVVLQRVEKAQVSIDGDISGTIGHGLLILLGIEDSDTEEDISWLCAKICKLRIFNDPAGIMNLSVIETGGEILVVSQFTLFASTKKGNRPSWIRSSKPETAIPLYHRFIARLEQESGRKVQTGQFGAMMKVSLINDGPVTILLDTKQKE